MIRDWNDLRFSASPGFSRLSDRDSRKLSNAWNDAQWRTARRAVRRCVAHRAESKPAANYSRKSDLDASLGRRSTFVAPFSSSFQESIGSIPAKVSQLITLQ